MAGQGIQLPKLISEGMVLQQGDQAKIWGWGQPTKLIEVTFQSRTYKAQVDEEGIWEVWLRNLEAGGPFSLEIQMNEEKLILKEVYVGEVWLCSGQSNMELPISRVKDRFPEVLEQDQYGEIHLFKIIEDYDFHGPYGDHTRAAWQTCDREHILDFSALSYFFAEALESARDVPIGIINASLGGSPIEAWMPESTLQDCNRLMALLKAYQVDDFSVCRLEEGEKLQSEWTKTLLEKDLGLQEPKWYSDRLIVEGTWRKIEVPCFFKDWGLEKVCGSIWLRRDFQVPKEMLEDEVQLWLGTIVDRDEVYINGQLVGRTEYQYPPRKYVIPKGILRSGDNNITLRITCDRGKGRITPHKDYKLFTKTSKVVLQGEWSYKIGAIMPSAPEVDFVKWKPTGLYNGMIAPCHEYSIKGVLWYQGESNASSPEDYTLLLTRLIQSWRHKWQKEDLPFIVIQLPNFEIDFPESGGKWPQLRAAQEAVCSLPYTGLVVTIDLGEANDLHPLNKKEIAKRAALVARAIAYQEDIIWQGPRVNQIAEEGSRIRLQCSHVYDRLEIKGGEQPLFELGDEQGEFKKAQVQIDGDTLVLESREINRASQVRYAYKDHPGNGGVYNSVGLPMAPFWEQVHRK